MGELDIRFFHVDDREGWKLAVRRYRDPETYDPSRRPVAILPGYGMNSFIFTYHPEGPSMAEFFARKGFEFWTVDLRAQGDSIADGGSPSYRMEDAGVTDLGVVVHHILDHTGSEQDRVDLLGCSLGATYIYIHLGMVPEHRVGSVVAIGGPLRWTGGHPAIRLAFSSPKLAGLVPFWGTGLLAELALPIIGKHAPWLLSFYLRAEHVDLEKAKVFTRTIEDPVPAVNEQIARYINQGDLIIDGVNITEEVGAFTGPFLCVFSNADGIVNRESALSGFDKVGSKTKEILELGTDTIKMAHADVYLSRHTHELMFEPVSEWLVKVGS